MKVFLAALLIVGICVVLLSVGIIVKGRFPQYDVGGNEEMRKRGITCFKDVDAQYHQTRKGCTGNFSDACKDCNLYRK